jgi:hypothetical protein
VRRFAPSAAAVLLASACAGRGEQVGLAADAAHFDRRIVRERAILRASGHNCSGLYGRWSVRLDVSGAAHGSGMTAFTLVPGKSARLPVSFRITAGALSGHATGSILVRPSGNDLLVRGLIKVEVAFRSDARAIAERIPLERGPTPHCGLSAD